MNKNYTLRALQQSVKRWTDSAFPDSDFKPDALYLTNKLMNCIIENNDVNEGIGKAVIYLSVYCTQHNIDLQDVVHSVFEKSMSAEIFEDKTDKSDNCESDVFSQTMNDEQCDGNCGCDCTKFDYLDEDNHVRGQE